MNSPIIPRPILRDRSYPYIPRLPPTRNASMNNRNQQTNRNPGLVQAPAPVQQSLPTSASTYLNVFTVEEYESNGKTQKKWTKIGAAFPHKEGLGFSIELKAFPMDGRLVVLPPDTDDNRNSK